MPQSIAWPASDAEQPVEHAAIEPHWEHFWRNGRPDYRLAGGYARAASVVRRIREETDGAAILVDCGDTIHGTGPAQWTTGAAVVPALNAMGVELMTPGNWDFGFGPAILRERGAEMAFPLIASNVDHAESGEPLFAPTEVRQIGGTQVGFIGVTLPTIPDTMSAGNRPSTSPDVSFRAPDPSFGAERVRIGASDKPIHREIEMTIQYSKKPNWFAASWFGQFMASGLGRATRIVAGVALIAGGLFAVGGTTGSILAVIGLVPLLAGTFDVCVFSRLFGGPFSGTAIRACASH